MTETEPSIIARAAASPRPRLEVKDALSICLAMIDEDPSLHPAALRMWNALVPFLPALTPAQEALARDALAVDRGLAPREAPPASR